MVARRIATAVAVAALAVGALVVSARPTDHPTAASSVRSPSSPPARASVVPSSPPSRDPVAVAAVDPDCPVTRPEPPFIAPEPWPATPPDRYHSAWYGRPALWTMLRFEGEIWTGLPLGPSGGYGQKTFWWSVRWPWREELMPAITVTGRRLDGPGSFQVGPPGTNAGADFGIAMLVGVEIPSTGCWEIVGSYRGATLSYVVWVGP